MHSFDAWEEGSSELADVVEIIPLLLKDPVTTPEWLKESRKNPETLGGIWAFF